jgi:hypothetical protein
MRRLVSVQHYLNLHMWMGMDLNEKFRDPEMHFRSLWTYITPSYKFMDPQYILLFNLP